MTEKKPRGRKKEQPAPVDLGDLNMVGYCQVVDDVPRPLSVATLTTSDGVVQQIPAGPLVGGSTPTQSLKFFSARFDAPKPATEWAAGMDIQADIPAGEVVSYFNSRNQDGIKTVKGDSASKGRLYFVPGDRILVPTGLYADIPENFYLAIHARSGTSWKKGLILTNGVGVVDADYVHEIKVSLTNISGVRQYIEDGERIAQLVLNPVVRMQITSLKEAPKSKTSRAGGFGSTGQ